jgi:long-chain acyl-CoA synthetase
MFILTMLQDKRLKKKSRRLGNAKMKRLPYSEMVTKDLQIPAFFDQLVAGACEQPDRVVLQAITERDKESFTQAALVEQVFALSSFLVSRGIQPGDHVGILMENHPRWGVAFLAVQSAGAVVVPLDPLHPPSTLAYLIQHAECRLLISDGKLQARLAEIRGLLANPVPALVVGEEDPDSSWQKILKQFVYRTENGRLAPLPIVPRRLEEPLVILYTSGTTGNPKGVVLTGRNLYRNVVEILSLIPCSKEDHLLSVLPLHHILALVINFVIPLWLGARVTFIDIRQTKLVMNSFGEEGITIFVCVPQFFHLAHRRILEELNRQPAWKRFLAFRLLKLSRFFFAVFKRSPGKLFFSSLHARFGGRLRFFGVGGARFDPRIEEFFRDLGFYFAQAYGLTETAALATFNPPDGLGVGSVGLPLPHVEVRIDRPGDDGIGEILLRGDNVMQGYLKNPEATAEAIRDGWLYTGDLGFVRDDGKVVITGRKSEVIVLSSGKNIYPEEIEQEYAAGAGLIKEIGVIGVSETPDTAPDKLHAVIVPDFEELKKAGISSAHDSIRESIELKSRLLPSHKRIRSFEIRSTPLPRTTTQKLKRHRIMRGEEEAAQPPDTSQSYPEPANPIEQAIFRTLKKLKPKAIFNPSASLEFDFGLDSLERVELLSQLEESLGVRLEEEESQRLLTLGQLIGAFAEHADPLGNNPEARISWGEMLATPLTGSQRQLLVDTLYKGPVTQAVLFLFMRLIYGWARLYFRMRVEGSETLPAGGPYLICPNHRSYLDAVLLSSVLPRAVIEKIFFLGISAYFAGGARSSFARVLKIIPVDAERHLRQALRLGAEGLRLGMILCVFPEGVRSIDGTLKPFRRGTAILAAELKVPVVPVGIIGTYQALPRGGRLIRPHAVTIRFGQPLLPGSEETPDSLNERMFTAVQSLLQTVD